MFFKEVQSDWKHDGEQQIVVETNDRLLNIKTDLMGFKFQLLMKWSKIFETEPVP